MDIQNHEKTLEKNLIVSYIAGFILLNITYLVFFIVLSEDILENSTFNTLTQVAYYGILTYYLTNLARHYLFVEERKKLKNDPKYFIGMIIAGFFLMFAVNGVIGLLLQNVGYTDTSINQEQLENLARSGPFQFLGIAFIAIICAPIVEELVFRKGVFGIFERKFNVVAAIFLSAFFFGFIHLLLEPTNILGLLPYLAMGIVLGFIYFLSGKNIYVPIIIHALWNILAISFIFIGTL